MQQLNINSPKVVFLNDRSDLNERYRSSLMTMVSELGYSVQSMGILDRFSFLTVMRILIPRLFSGAVVSSNLRTNILVLLFWHTHGVVILNGLGRYRTSTPFRKFLILLIRVNRRKSIAIQSYADYRYFRRFTNSSIICWVPGSGGTPKKASDQKNPFCVQRNDKLSIVADSLRQLLQTGSMVGKLSIVGCDASDQTASLFPPDAVTFVGYQPSADVFTNGGVFVQPSGYGEGIPHTLVNAIASKVEIAISHREFVRYGLYKLKARRTPIANGWVKLISTEHLVAAISEASVNASYIDLINKAISNYRVRDHETSR